MKFDVLRLDEPPVLDDIDADDDADGGSENNNGDQHEEEAAVAEDEPEPEVSQQGFLSRHLLLLYIIVCYYLPATVFKCLRLKRVYCLKFSKFKEV